MMNSLHGDTLNHLQKSEQTSDFFMAGRCQEFFSITSYCFLTKIILSNEYCYMIFISIQVFLFCFVFFAYYSPFPIIFIALTMKAFYTLAALCV